RLSTVIGGPLFLTVLSRLAELDRISRPNSSAMTFGSFGSPSSNGAPGARALRQLAPGRCRGRRPARAAPAGGAPARQRAAARGRVAGAARADRLLRARVGATRGTRAAVRTAGRAARCPGRT